MIVLTSDYARALGALEFIYQDAYSARSTKEQRARGHDVWRLMHQLAGLNYRSVPYGVIDAVEGARIAYDVGEDELFASELRLAMSLIRGSIPDALEATLELAREATRNTQ